MTMSLLANTRARFHPGSYLWQLPTFAVLVFKITNISFDRESIYCSLLLITYVHFSNFLIWIHNKNERRTIVFVCFNALIAIVSGESSVAIAGLMCISILVGYLFKSLFRSVVTSLVVIAFWLIFQKFSSFSIIPFMISYFFAEIGRFIGNRVTKMKNGARLSSYFIIGGMILLISAASLGSLEHLQASFLVSTLFIAIK
jgi:hypothetical protein